MIIFQLIQKPQKRGAEIFAAQLSQKLEELGNKVILISVFEGVCDLPFSGETIHLNRPLSKRWFDLEGWKKMSTLIKKYNPEIIQCNAGDTLKFAVLSKQFFGWKSLIVARNASTVSSYINSDFTKLINRFLYSKTASIISVSEHSKTDLNLLFANTKIKTIVIPIGVENNPINEVEWKTANQASVNVIHVGGFTFEKNHVGLFNIWEKYLLVEPDAVLHLFGDGPLKHQMEQIVKNKKIDNSVVFYGWVPNPIDFIAKADVLVLPSIIEGLPGVIIEAMYCKTSVVAYNVGGVSEIIENNKTGFLIEKGNENSFVEALKGCILAKNKMMLDAAKDLVSKNYTNQNIALNFLKHYNNIIKI